MNGKGSNNHLRVSFLPCNLRKMLEDGPFLKAALSIMLLSNVVNSPMRNECFFREQCFFNRVILYILDELFGSPNEMLFLVAGTVYEN